MRTEVRVKQLSVSLSKKWGPDKRDHDNLKATLNPFICFGKGGNANSLRSLIYLFLVHFNESRYDLLVTWLTYSLLISK